MPLLRRGFVIRLLLLAAQTSPFTPPIGSGKTPWEPTSSPLVLMTWRDTWRDILAGGSPRWKVDNLEYKERALQHIVEHSERKENLNILCPLVGDDQFVFQAFMRGHSVYAIDLVPEALAEIRKQFDNQDGWRREETETGSGVRWTHPSGQVVLLEGDILQRRKELERQFDVVYDKDSFGALQKDLRSPYCERMSEWLKEDGIVYLEVKNKDTGRENGPPFHIEEQDIMSSWGASFEYIKGIGEVYPLRMAGFAQMGHLLKHVK